MTASSSRLAAVPVVPLLLLLLWSVALLVGVLIGQQGQSFELVFGAISPQPSDGPHTLFVDTTDIYGFLASSSSTINTLSIYLVYSPTRTAAMVRLGLYTIEDNTYILQATAQPVEFSNSDIFRDLLRAILALETPQSPAQSHLQLHHCQYSPFHRSLQHHPAHHDGYIDQSDLATYDDYSLTSKMIERVIGGYGRRLLSSVEGKMNYLDFIIFLISEVDKSNTVSIQYWFNTLDLDGDGLVTSYEMEYFFDEQKQRIQSLSQEQITFIDILCQLVDMIKGGDGAGTDLLPLPYTTPDKVVSRLGLAAAMRLREADGVLFDKRMLFESSLAPQFFNTLFNLNKFIQSEQRDPIRIKQIHDTPQLSDWDRYAISGYYRLAEVDTDGDAIDDGADGEVVDEGGVAVGGDEEVGEEDEGGGGVGGGGGRLGWQKRMGGGGGMGGDEESGDVYVRESDEEAADDEDGMEVDEQASHSDAHMTDTQHDDVKDK